MSEQTKVCSKCGCRKELNAFHRSKTGTLGIHAYCKDCSSSYSKDRNPGVYLKTKDRVIKRASDWQRANPDRYKIRLKAWQDANRTILLEAKKIDTKRRIEELSDGYVAGCVGIPLSECHDDLIELKREQLRIHRITKQLKKEITNV